MYMYPCEICVPLQRSEIITDVGAGSSVRTLSAINCWTNSPPHFCFLFQGFFKQWIAGVLHVCPAGIKLAPAFLGSNYRYSPVCQAQCFSHLIPVLFSTCSDIQAKVTTHSNKLTQVPPKRSVVVWIRMVSIGSYIWMLSYQGLALFGRIRRYGLVGVAVSLEMGFEVSKTQAGPTLRPSPCCLWIWDRTPSYLFSCLHYPMLPAMMIMD